MDNNFARVEFALRHVLEHSVMTISYEDWQRLVLHSGEPTEIVTVPGEISGIMSAASRVVVAGSGIVNPDPGVDVVRRDLNDAPMIYNTDHYTVIENLAGHTDYSRILYVAGVEDSAELRETLANHVFVVGPYQLDNHHWSAEIHEAIRNAKEK